MFILSKCPCKKSYAYFFTETVYAKKSQYKSYTIIPCPDEYGLQELGQLQMFHLNLFASDA